MKYLTRFNKIFENQDELDLIESLHDFYTQKSPDNMTGFFKAVKKLTNNGEISSKTLEEFLQKEGIVSTKVKKNRLGFTK